MRALSADRRFAASVRVSGSFPAAGRGGGGRAVRAGGCRGRGLPRGAAGRPAPCLRRERPGRGRSAPGDARLRRRAPGPSSWRLTSAARSSSGPSCGAEVTSTGARSAAVCSGPASCVWSPKERSRRSRRTARDMEPLVREERCPGWGWGGNWEEQIALQTLGPKNSQVREGVGCAVWRFPKGPLSP